ncbi:MAG: autotransporter outer membrane beta-barrel domain-containing protein [Simkaniaceae bacterium]|nr:MAG: autotransporter outer membrane beta-barrel domain-containing protein [Simkaniaceae bacterium]
MEMKLRKLWPLVGTMLGLTSSVFAHSNYQNSTTSSSASDASMDSSSQSTYQRGTFREITPSAGPRVTNGADVFITADFIWWKASEEGLSSSGSGLNTGGATDAADVFSSPSKGKIVAVGEDWAPGFKVGLGLNMGHDGWDLYAQYTWLHASDSKTQKGPNLYLPEYVPADQGPSYFSTENSAKWDLHFNVIDLELGRNFYLSQFLTMRPHIGLKGTWQDHDWKITSKLDGFEVRVNNQPQGVALTGPANISKHYDVWGIGVRGGFNIAWYMSKSWSFYGDLALSTLWTNYHKLTYTAKIDDTTTGNSRGLANIDSDNLYTCKYIAELELGLRWETWFYDDNYHFAIQAGWEQQTWVNWSAFHELLYSMTNDFSVQGLNLKFRFDF